MYSAIIGVLDKRYKNSITLMICSVLDHRFEVELINYDLSNLKTKITELCETNFKSYHI